MVIICRWTGASSSPWTVLLLIHTLIQTAQLTTWATHTETKVRLLSSDQSKCNVTLGLGGLMFCCWCLCFIGAFYNIIRVPPERDGPEDTLEGAKILCSIAPRDKSKPSYYHSFGERRRESVMFIIFRSLRQDRFSFCVLMKNGHHV